MKVAPLDVVCAIIERDGKILVAKRQPGGPAGDKWEFPGGKIRRGETADEAICREIAEELGCTVRPLGELKRTLHKYPDFTVSLLPMICELDAGEPKALEHAEIKWLVADQLSILDWAEADLAIVTEYLHRAECADK